MSLKVLLVVALLMSAVLAAVPKPEELDGYSFEQYVKDFYKTYDGKEYFRRKALFLRNLADVVKHNRDTSSSYVKGVNHMSDWTAEEFSRLNGGKIHTMANLADKKLQKKYKSSSAPLPAQVDYRGHVPAVLTAVKDQGQCGSCWAHAAIETIETHNALVTGNLFVLSQQELTACTPNPNNCGGTGGCYGSIADLAYEYVIKSNIGTEWQYPYTAYYGNTGECQQHGSVASATDYVKVKTNDQDAVLDALARVGPLAVNVDASNWHSYSGGIFDGCSFSKNIDINHVVQLVGYGHDAGLGKDYWIIRNSWGPTWGEQGYMRMLKTDKAECGTDNSMQDGTACDGDPSTATVCGMCGMLYDASYIVMSKWN